MKSSRFNYILDVKGEHILYNTLSKRMLLLNTTLMDMYNSAISNQEILELQYFHPTFYEKLTEDGFLIEDNTDETNEVRKIMHEVDRAESNYYLIINPTMNCNFKCWYCYETHIKESRMTNETVSNIINFVRKILIEKPQIKHLTIGWFGGEPLLYFGNIMLPIIEQLDVVAKEQNVLLSQNMTTNGFLINESMIEYFKKYNFTSFQITLDGNSTVHDTIRFVSKNRGSYSDIVKNIKMLASNHIPVTARINYTKITLENLEDIYDDFKELQIDALKYLDISFHQVWQDGDRNLNTRVDEIVDFFQKKGITTSNSSIPDTLFNSCYADKWNNATINYDGNVFKCTARDFNENHREGILDNNGDIQWNDNFYKRMDIKLRNKPCQTCKILPLCNGGCSQVALEANGEDYCVYGFDENAKADVVMRKVEGILNRKVLVE